MNESNFITPWIPVIGTLSGAILGFFASFLIAFFNRKTENLKEKTDRDRKRLERIYELLVSIKKERSMRIAHLMNWVHHGTQIPDSEEINTQISPLVELEMLIKLYFIDLESCHKSFLTKVQEFGACDFEVQKKNYRSKPLEEKQKECTILMNHLSQINKEVEAFQTQISKIIKA